MEINKLSIDELIELYGKVTTRLKDENVIRTKNVVGELGEYLAIEHYTKTKGLPKLSAALISTKSFDAISRAGDRYSIKATTGKITGVFYGLSQKDSNQFDEKTFEYVIIVKFNKNMVVESIIEFDWDTFIKHKKWHSTMRAWNISLTKALLSDSKIIHSLNA